MRFLAEQLGENCEENSQVEAVGRRNFNGKAAFHLVLKKGMTLLIVTKKGMLFLIFCAFIFVLSVPLQEKYGIWSFSANNTIEAAYGQTNRESLPGNLSSYSELKDHTDKFPQRLPENLSSNSDPEVKVKYRLTDKVPQSLPENSAQNLSQKLKQAFNSYQDMHANCLQHKDITHLLLNPDFPDQCKYLVYVEGFDGLGNRILAMVSAFVYALITDRVFLIDSRGHLAKLLKEPFRESSWLLPENFPYHVVHSAPDLEKAALSNCTIVHLRLRHDSSEADRQFFCSEIQAQLERVPWIAWSSNQYYIPRFFTIFKLWKKLRPLFPLPHLALHTLSRYMLLPNPIIWSKIERIRSTYLSSGNKLVGVQVRTHSVNDTSAFYPSVHRRIMHCLVNHNVLPNVSFNSSTPSIPTGAHTITVLLTSLQMRYYEEMRNLYIDHPTLDGSLIQVHMVSHDGREKHSLEQAVDAFIEIWLLSFSDYLAISSWSTFGYVAQSLAGPRVHPFLMNVRGDFKKDGLPPCSVANSIDPCNHYPFSIVSCTRGETSSKRHVAWMKRHLRACKDEPQGIQLVPSSFSSKYMPKSL